MTALQRSSHKFSVSPFARAVVNYLIWHTTVRFHNMRINFRGFDVGVPHEFLNDTDIGATFKLMRGKTVAQGVTAGFLVDSGTG